MPTVSEQLRAAREARELTVYQVAEATKIKTEHVRALDDGDFDVFSATVFLRGFVRTYAALLRLDVPKIMEELDRELKGSQKFSDHPPLTNEPKGVLDWITLQLSRLNWAVVLPLLILITVILVGFFGWRAWREHETRDPLSELGSGLYQPDETTRGRTLPLTE